MVLRTVFLVLMLFASVARLKNSSINCPENCVCEDVENFLGDDEPLNGFSSGIRARTSGAIILLELTLEYHLYLTGLGVICLRHNFRELPVLVLSGQSDNITEQEKTKPKISVLMMRCGFLRSITVKNLPGNLEVADFSENQIRYITEEAMGKLANLKVLDLQHNFLTKIPHSDDVLRIPLAQTKSPAILLEGNPLICSCSLFTVITRHLGNDEGTCTLDIRKNSTSSGSPNTGSTITFPLHFFEYISSELSRFCFDPQTTFEKYMEGQRDNLYSYNAIHLGEGAISRSADVLERRIKTLDYPLLIIMNGWFLMVFIGIRKFIKANDTEYEVHRRYLSMLDRQRNSVLGSIKVAPKKGKRAPATLGRRRKNRLTDSELNLIS